MKNYNEKDIKAFRKFLVNYFDMNYKKKDKIIKKTAKINMCLSKFLENIKDFTVQEQRLLLEQYDNPEVNNWL